MHEHKFDPSKMDRLNNPKRIDIFPVKEVLEILNLGNPEIIVDYGAGTAFFSKYISEIKPFAKIFALDIEPKMTHWVKVNISSNYPNIVPLRIEENKIPLEDNSVDFLFTVSLHHELDNPIDTLNEFRRVLKIGAPIAISDWRKESTQNGPPIKIRCNPNDVQYQINQVGFRNSRIIDKFKNNFLVIAYK